MDPLTRAAEHFTSELTSAWRRASVVRLAAPDHHRSHLVRSLRLLEWASDNRWPMCLVEAPADDLGRLADLAYRQLLADLAVLRAGLAEDGDTIPDPAQLAAGVPSGLEPLVRLHHLVDRAGEVLARTGVVAGLALVFVPTAPLLSPVLQHLAAALADWPGRPHLRCALAVRDPVLPVSATFTLDDAALNEYCRQQSARQNATAPPDEVAVRRHLLAAAAAAEERDLPAAREAYRAAVRALEARDRLAEAAVVHIALGGLAFALHDGPAALSHFEHAVAHGTATRQPAVLSQAHLGAAGVLFSGREFAAAAARYQLSADSGASAILRIEALRMAGTCHWTIGEQDLAARAWHAAVTEAGGLPPTARSQTNWKQAGESLLVHLQRRGLRAEADRLHALLHADEGKHHVTGR